MICLDVAYGDNVAYAAGLAFRNWPDREPLEERVVPVPLAKFQLYRPGEFFRRELPCLVAVLGKFPPADVVIVAKSLTPLSTGQKYRG